MDVKKQLVEGLSRARDFYLKDLGYIPVDKFDVSPMGKAKTAKVITLECSGLNRMLARLIDGEEAKHPSPEDRKAWYDSYTDPEKVKAEFKDSFDALVSKVDGMDATALARMITAPWGQPLSLGEMLMMGINHTTYHDGQLNYIQALYGDDQFHWLE